MTKEIKHSALRQAREQMGLTQAQVARGIGLNSNVVAMIERRVYVAPRKYREGLSTFFGRSEDCFFDAETGLAV